MDNAQITTFTPAKFKSELRDVADVYRLNTDRSYLIDRLRGDLRVIDLRAAEKIADILLDSKLSTPQACDQIEELVLGRAQAPIAPQRDNTLTLPSVLMAQNIIPPVATAASLAAIQELKEQFNCKIKLVFRTKKGIEQFNHWRSKISHNYAKDLVNEGFLNALNEQQQRKHKYKVPLFSKLIMKEQKRHDRDFLLPNDFEVDYLPHDVEVEYYVNGQLVPEDKFPRQTHTPANTVIKVQRNFNPDESSYSRARTHNFVRYLAYHSNILREISPLDPIAVAEAIDDLIRVKNMIGISKLVETLKKDFKLFSHPTGAPRGVLLWGPPGTGKTYVITTLLNYMGIALVCDPLAAGDFQKGIVGESELMINEIAKRAKAVPWMTVAVSIDEIDGLVPNRQGSSASGSNINMISVLLSVVGGNKDTPNLVLFGATNRMESMDEAALRRMPTKSFVGRPSAKARNEYVSGEISQLIMTNDYLQRWIEKNLLLPGKIVLRTDKTKFLSEVAKLTVNFSNDAMRNFVNYMETLCWDQPLVVTNDNYEKFWELTLQNALSVCTAERILIADSYLPNLIQDWKKYERIADERFPTHHNFLNYATTNALRKRYFKAVPRIFLDMNASSGQIQIKESRGEEDMTQVLKSIRDYPFAYIMIPMIREKLYELGDVDKELKRLIEEMYVQHNALSKLFMLATTLLVKDNRLVDQATLESRVAGAIGQASQLATAVTNMWHVVVNAFDFRPGDEVSNEILTDMLLTADEALSFRKSTMNFITAAERAFSLKSKVKTFSIMNHIDAAEFDHHEALHLLFQFVVHGDFGCFHYIDASYLYRKGITEENMQIRHIAAVIEEASQYPSAMIAIDLDSISGVHKEVTGLKKEMTSPHTDLSGGSFGPTISYRSQKQELMNMVIELAKSNTPVWLAIICKHPYLTNKFKETLDWWTDEERAEQEAALKREEELKVNKICNHCHEHFTEADNGLNACGRHRNPDSLYIDEHYEVAEEKKLRRYTRDQVERLMQEKNIPRNRVHYFCCGNSVDAKGELPAKHVGNPLP